jgi:hypothetical protein
MIELELGTKNSRPRLTRTGKNRILLKGRNDAFRCYSDLQIEIFENHPLAKMQRDSLDLYQTIIAALLAAETAAPFIIIASLPE